MENKLAATYDEGYQRQALKDRAESFGRKKRAAVSGDTVVQVMKVESDFSLCYIVIAVLYK